MSLLAQWAPGVAAIACWAAVLLLVWLVFFRVRNANALVAAAAFLFWTVFFGLLFITAGPDPLLHRADVVGAVRFAELLGAISWLVWVVLLAYGSVTVIQPSESTV